MERRALRSACGAGDGQVAQCGRAGCATPARYDAHPAAIRRSSLRGTGVALVGAMHDEQDDKTTYKVVLNHEEQYSIWPADRENAPGWRDEGTVGPKAECLAHIREIWTDMRPLSLRKAMAGEV